MSQSNDSFNPFDPTGVLKGMRDTSMENWSKMLIQFVGTNAYAEATGTVLDAWLSSSAPFRKMLETAMSQALANAQMPSRAEVAGVAGRLTGIEMRLDDLEAKLDEALRAGRKRAPAPGPKPAAAENDHDAN
jgi:hypothetical protein